MASEALCDALCAIHQEVDTTKVFQSTSPEYCFCSLMAHFLASSMSAFPRISCVAHAQVKLNTKQELDKL